MSSAQKGRNDLRLASLRTDAELIRLAREIAFEIIGDDPELPDHPDAARRARSALHRRRRGVPHPQLTDQSVMPVSSSSARTMSQRSRQSSQR